MDEDIQFFPTKDYLEVGDYSLTFLECKDNHLMLLIKESSKEVISELFADKGLGEIYNEYQKGDFQEKGLEIFLRLYFESNKDKANKMFAEFY